MNEFTFPSFFAKFAPDSGKTVYENKKYIIYWSHHVSLSNHLSFHPTPLLYFKQNIWNT